MQTYYSVMYLNLNKDGHNVCIIVVFIGLLDVVSNITIEQVNTTAVELSFVPPTSLDNVPITNYSIQVFSGSTHHSVVWAYGHDGLYITDLDTCSDYDIVVAAWNNVGEGHNVTTHLQIYGGKFLSFIQYGLLSVFKRSHVYYTSCE